MRTLPRITSVLSVHDGVPVMEPPGPAISACQEMDNAETSVRF